MLYLIILIVGGIASYFGPWWSLALVAFVLCAWKAKSGKEAFGLSALAGVSLWLGYSLFLLLTGGQELGNKVAQLFAASSDVLAKVPSLGLLSFIITVVALLSTGFAGLAGKHVRSFIK